MKHRILAEWLTGYGELDECGDYNLDLYQYEIEEVQTLKEGCKLIKDNDHSENGIGVITEEVYMELPNYPGVYNWEEENKHWVNGGVITDSEVLEIY